MLGKVIPCALCQAEAATVFCVNDDAHLCAGCDASVHASNPLLARHERRPLTALACTAVECASAAQNCPAPTASSPASTDCADVAVVPQLCSGGDPTEADASPAAAELQSALVELPAQQQVEMAEVEAVPFAAFAEPAEAVASMPAAVPAASPLSLYEDSFFSRVLTTNDLLDLDGDELELPAVGCSSASFPCFNPLDDGVVPSFGAPAPSAADRFMPAGPSGLHSQQVRWVQCVGRFGGAQCQAISLLCPAGPPSMQAGPPRALPPCSFLCSFPFNCCLHASLSRCPTPTPSRPADSVP